MLRSLVSAVGTEGRAARFDAFLREVCPPLGLEWRRYRRRAARNRVEARMRSLGLLSGDYPAYLERLRADPEEARTLADRMRVTITRFLREREVWETLIERVLPVLLAEAAPEGEGTLRAWSAGAAGGEEPYSLAIVWRERFGAQWPEVQLDLLATDIDDASLERLRAGRYQPATLRELPAAWRERWFRPAPPADDLELSREIRAMVRPERHNLMEDPLSLPGTRDLVLCRYLAFTYYLGDRRIQAARRVAEVLRPGAALMLGAKEDPLEVPWFEPWPSSGHRALYRRTCAT
jgi:chemotaxis protein methyltransferase CheR